MRSREWKESKLQLSKEKTIRAAKESLLGFTLYTKPDYKDNWHHRSYAHVLDRFIRGEIKRLMVFMPPQHGKSELCSRRMPAKILGDNPDKRVAVCAYNHTFASKFNRDVQRIIDSRQYRDLYPDTTLSGKNVRSDASGSWLRNSDEFEIVGKRGSLISVGIGGGLTGNKVDVAIIDDPYKDAQQANSGAYKHYLREWWESVLETRLNNDGQICLTFTRWRHDDIAGYLLDLQDKGITTDEWVVVRYEALKEAGHSAPEDKRKPDDPLWPEEHGFEKLSNIRAKAPSMFAALFQGRPTPKGGNIIKDSHFFRYELTELPDAINHVYIDTAQSEAELKGNDPTGILVYRVYQNRLYLVYFEKGMWGISSLVEKIGWIADKFLSGRNSKVYIENKSNGRSVKDLLEKGTNLSVILENIKGGKRERLEIEEPVLEAKRVGLPLGDHWTKDFLNQLYGFPLLAHDEEVDCLTGAIRTGLGTANTKALPKFINTKWSH